MREPYTSSEIIDSISNMQKPPTQTKFFNFFEWLYYSDETLTLKSSYKGRKITAGTWGEANYIIHVVASYFNLKNFQLSFRPTRSIDILWGVAPSKYTGATHSPPPAAPLRTAQHYIATLWLRVWFQNCIQPSSIHFFFKFKYNMKKIKAP